MTHDPKLDDLVLLEALKSPAFYVGALGSRGNTAKRKERLALFDLSAAEIARLHGPIGLDIGSRTPAEIAVSILAEIVAVRNGVALKQKKPVAGDRVSPGARRSAAVIPWLRGPADPLPDAELALGAASDAPGPGRRRRRARRRARLAEAYAQGHLPLVQRRPAGAVVVARPAHGAAAGRVQAAALAAQDDPRASLGAGRLRDPHRQRVPRASSTPAPRAPRDGQAGTWIVPEMIDAYAAWHDAGRVHSVETWIDGELAGGLYGVSPRPHVLRRVDVRAPHRRLEDRAGGAGRASAATTASRPSTASSAPRHLASFGAPRDAARASSSSASATALAMPPVQRLDL